MEAAWLAAIAVIPLFLVPTSDRMFEPAKVAILRTLAGVMCAAWLVAWLAAPRPSGAAARRARNSLALPVLLLLTATLVSTATGISPEISLMGAYDRAQGLYTTASYLAIFFLVAHGMGSRRQVERAVSAALVASFAVALYALLQHLGLDPLPGDPAFPGGGGSTLGNPAFLGGYLAMTAPLALARLTAAARTAVGTAAARVPRVVLYALLLALQVVAILLSEVRGAILGLLGGLCIFVVLRALLAGRRVAAGAAVAATVTLVALAALSSAYYGRGDPTAEVRVRIWETAARLTLPHAALRSPEGPDGLNALRPLVGYGPDSFYAASGQRLSGDLGPLQGRTARPDHAHNEPLDALVQTGVVGLAAYLLLLSSVFYVALASLGWIRSARERRAFAAVCAGGAVLVPAIVALAVGSAYVGVAIAAGTGLGVLTFLFATRPGQRFQRPSDPLVAALLAALTAHVVETQVSIANTAARSLFWILAAALVVVCARRGEDDPETGGTGAEECSTPVRAGIVALVVITLVFAFVSASTTPFRDGDNLVVLILLVASTGFAMGIGGRLGRPRIRAPVVTATLALLLAFAAAHLYAVARSEDGDLWGFVASVAVVITFLVVVLVALGAALATQRPRSARAASRLRVAAALAAGAILAVPSLWLNSRIVQGDIVHQQAASLAEPDQLVRHFEGAVAKQPLHDRAHTLLADIHLRRARAAPGRRHRDHELAGAGRALLRARALNPFDPDHTLELAVMHERAAALAGSEGEARMHFERSRRIYRQATRMSPGSAYVRDRRAHALLEYSRLQTGSRHYASAGRLRAEARRQLDRALSLDRDYCLTFAIRAHTRAFWRAAVRDSLTAVDRSGPPQPCGGEGLERHLGTLVVRGLARAAELAEAAGERTAFIRLLRSEAQAEPGSARARAAAQARRRVQAAPR